PARDPARRGAAHHHGRHLDPDHAEHHDHHARRGLRPDGQGQGPAGPPDHARLRGPQRDPAQPDRVRHVDGFRGQRRDPDRVRVQLPGGRLHAAPGRAERGLPADAGTVPADHRGGAGGDPDRGRRHRDSRPADQDGGLTIMSMPISGITTGQPDTGTGTAPVLDPAGPGVPVAPGAVPGGAASALRRMTTAIRRNRKATIGAVLLVLFVLVAIFPWLIANDNPTADAFKPRLGVSTAPLLGTTAYGQDMWAQLVWGTRNVIIIAFAAGLATTFIAVMVGVAAAYLGGLWDGALGVI